MTVTQERLSLEQFLELPEEEPALEFEDGVVSQKVSPKGKHSLLQLRIAERINRSTVSAKAAMAFPELRASYAGRSYVPDVSVYRWQRIAVDADGEVADDFIEPPDIAIDVVSPKQGVNRLIRRCLWYIEHGVRIALVIDPADRSVLVFRPGTAPQALHGDDRIELGDVIPDVELTVVELFAFLRID
jgi:Uma2 family endonuclease